MKRPLAIVIAVCAALALGACGGSDDSGDGGSPSVEGNDDLLTSAGFEQAVNAVAGQEGSDSPILRVQITSGGAEFQIRQGEQATGYIYTGGELQPIDVQVIGGGSLEGQDFPLTEVDPAAIDKIRTGVAEESGISDIQVTVMTLEKQITDGQLRWVVNADGAGRTGLVFNADPDGSNVTAPGGPIAGGSGSGGSSSGASGNGGGGSGSGGGASGDSGGAPSASDAQAIADCIAEANGDVQKIQKCTQ